MVRFRGGAPVAAMLVAGLLAGCGGSDSGSSTGSGNGSTPGGASSGKISVVASTNVWGDVAQQIGGDKVAVTSFIADPSQDPHSFESSGRNQLAIKKAKLVLENGGGYDDFMDTLRKSSGGNAAMINAVDVSGKKAPSGGELNEHVWYDFPTTKKVAEQIENKLSDLDPSSASTFKANLASFEAKMDKLETQEKSLKASNSGKGVAITEPVPLYMLEASGLSNKTPDKFSEAVEEGEDVSTAVLNDTLKLFSGKKVAALVYNEQTSGAVTEKVKNASTSAGIPVVPVTETLPKGKDYVTWMNDNLDALGKALQHK